MRNTKIICTIGPASEDKETLEKLMYAGMDIARLNFSHGNHEEHLARIESIREVSKKVGKKIGILLDTKGPEIRTGDMATPIVELKKGETLSVSMDEVLGNSETISITYPGLINDIAVGDDILLDDGIITLKVTAILNDENIIQTVVQNDGIIKNKKGVNVPGVKVNLPALTDKDQADILFGIENKVDFIAPSFIRKAQDVLDIRELLEKNNGDYIKIVPKIENQEGIDNIDDILLVSDGLMVARGDLGVEIPTEMVPLAQKELIKKCNYVGKPVITAT
ncbi:MAG TPA: pyruvate kinase, partial [Jeotgalicoccus sp.]|nr:pyruvate kinase [Jeotgalicoccus sp.]